MPSTRPPVLGDDPSSLDALWSALEPAIDQRPPRIRAVMITSLDGSATVDGLTEGLATPTDQLVFHAMRARADMVLVGASTALAEGYGPAVVHPEWADRRDGPPPVVVLLARTLREPVVAHCEGTGAAVQLAVGPDVDPDALTDARARGVTVHVLDAGPLGAAVRALATRLGADEVDFEGGPRILATLLAEDAVDELVLSLAPEVIVGGDSHRLVREGDEGGRPHRTPMRVAAAFTGPDGGLYTRWVVDRGAR